MISPIIPIWLLIIILVPLTIYVAIKVRGIKLIIRILMIILVFLICIRIQIPNGFSTQESSNLDLIFVVDNTISMQAVDGRSKGRRIDDVKKDIEYIVDKLPVANYSLITFFYDAEIKIPLTYDKNSFMVSVRNLKEPTMFYARGSNITMFKNPLEQVLKSSAKRDARERVVFIMSDGENNNEDKNYDLSDLSKYIDNGAVLGYGTTKGATMKVQNYYYDTYETVMDGNKEAISKLDEDNLKEIAKDLGIDYIYMNDISKIDNKLDKIDNYELSSEINKNSNYNDIYYYFAFVLSLLFVIELVIDKRSL
jgi:Ca-activated chloride channel family protein